jgi:hypothetical protein
MRTTLNIEDDLIDKAIKITGIKKTALVKLGWEALIARESARRLAKLGGTQKQLQEIPRRKGNVTAHVICRHIGFGLACEGREY